MYTGSYSASIKMSGITILSALAVIMACVTLLILPIVMALKFNCKRKKLIILLHIALFFVIGPLNGIISFILITLDKSKSGFYEKNNISGVSSFHVILYVLNILVLFFPIAKVKNFSNYDIDGLTKFNLSFFIGKKSESINNLLNQNDYKLVMIMIWVMLGIMILGFILNLIFRNARKLMGINALFQAIISVITFIFAKSLNNGIIFPGTALLLEACITIIFVISLYIIISIPVNIDN